MGGATISAGPLIEQLQRAGKDKRVAGVVLRIDSPGGDALASDLLWRAIRELGDRKPVVASMGDVAASGAQLLIHVLLMILAKFVMDLTY